MSETLQALGGAALEQFLDRLEADMEEGVSRSAADLAARLRAQPLRADSLSAVDRLYRLWMHADDPQAALAAVDDDGAALAAAAAPAEKPALEMQLAQYRLCIARKQHREAAILAALAQLREGASRLSSDLAEEYRHWGLLEEFESAPLAQALGAIELRQALNLAVEGRNAYRAYDLADYHSRRAKTFSRAKQTAEARIVALEAIAALRDTTPGQDVDCDDWQKLGASLIEIVPDKLAAFEQPVHRLTASWALPRRREEEVRLARLAARALYAQGNLAGALAACDKARYSLDCGGGDDFIEHELPWLIEAGRIDEAGRRAFWDIYDREYYMWPGTARIVHERIGRADDDSVWWPLCVMRSCTRVETLGCFLEQAGDDTAARRAFSPVHAQLLADAGKAIDEQATKSVFAAARTLAEKRAPGHPWIRRLDAVQDEIEERIDAAASLKQLEELAQGAGLRDNRTRYAILMARIKAHGFAAAMREPVPTFDCGEHAYSYGVALNMATDEHLPERWRDEETWKRAVEMRKSVYEQGIAHCERRFETGRGHPYDGCAHLYSMMCNNLAIDYRHAFDRYEEAISLHERGIAASPFAEHYAGILRARFEMQDWANMVNAAEQLWHYAAEYGYSRHDPNDYVTMVARALNRTGRDHEIPIWLERLTAWQRGEGEKDDALSYDTLLARVSVCLYMDELPHEAAALWRQLEPQVRASKEYLIWSNAASAAERRGEPDLAIELCRQAIALNPRDTPYDQEQATAQEEQIAEIQARASTSCSPKKAWWKFW